MTDIHAKSFMRIGNRLAPSDQFAEEYLAGLPEGKEVLIVIKRARSVQQHRLLFAVLRAVCQNSEIWNDEDELLAAIKLSCGHTEPRMTLDGSVYRAPRSISFAAMGQDAFQRFLNRALFVLGRMLGVSPEQLLAEVMAEQRHAPPLVPLQSDARAKEDA